VARVSSGTPTGTTSFQLLNIMFMKSTTMTNTEKVQYAALQNSDLSEDTIRTWLKKDVESAYCLMLEILNNKDMLDALTSVLYNRYKEYHSKSQEGGSDVR